jgi:hypothetical protein
MLAGEEIGNFLRAMRIESTNYSAMPRLLDVPEHDHHIGGENPCEKVRELEHH